MMKFSRLFLVLFLSISVYSLFGQGNLSIIGPRSYVSNFSKSQGRHSVDTITILPGNVLKIENAALAQWQSQSNNYVMNSHHLVEIGDVFLSATQLITASGVPWQQSSFPCWLGAGTYYVNINIHGSGVGTFRLSIHGLLFSLQ